VTGDSLISGEVSYTGWMLSTGLGSEFASRCSDVCTRWLLNTCLPMPTHLRHLWPSPPAIGWPWLSRLPTFIYLMWPHQEADIQWTSSWCGQEGQSDQVWSSKKPIFFCRTISSFPLNEFTVTQETQSSLNWFQRSITLSQKILSKVQFTTVLDQFDWMTSCSW